MRKAVAALLVLALLSTAVGAAVAGSGTHGTRAYGTVAAGGEGVAGAYVIVQPAGAGTLQRATNGSAPVVESLLRLADDPPRGVYVNSTDPAGSYAVHVPRAGEYEMVAVAEDGRVSGLRTVDVGIRGTREDLAVDAERIQQIEGGDTSGTPGETTTVAVRLPNGDDEPVTGLTVGLAALPDGWTVESVESDGAAAVDGRTVRWDEVGPGETATAEVTLSVPEDAALETYRIEFTASADSHHVEHTDAARVLVSRTNSTRTPTPSATPLGGESVDVDVPERTPADGAGSGGIPPLSVAVFSVGVAIAAYAVGRTGLPYLGLRGR